MSIERSDFETLCLMVELVIACPGGMADHLDHLGWEGKAILERFIAMRTRHRANPITHDHGPPGHITNPPPWDPAFNDDV